MLLLTEIMRILIPLGVDYSRYGRPSDAGGSGGSAFGIFVIIIMIIGYLIEDRDKNNKR